MNIETISLIMSGLATLGTIILGFLQLTKRPPRPQSQETLDLADASAKVTQSAIDMSQNYARQIGEMKAQYQTEIAALRREVEQLRAKVAAFASMEVENSALRKEVSELRNENKTLQEEIEALQIRIAFLEGERKDDKINPAPPVV